MSKSTATTLVTLAPQYRNNHGHKQDYHYYYYYKPTPQTPPALIRGLCSVIWLSLACLDKAA